jgi:hypothetical protein
MRPPLLLLFVDIIGALPGNVCGRHSVPCQSLASKEQPKHKPQNMDIISFAKHMRYLGGPLMYDNVHDSKGVANGFYEYQTKKHNILVSQSKSSTEGINDNIGLTSQHFGVRRENVCSYNSCSIKSVSGHEKQKHSQMFDDNSSFTLNGKIYNLIEGDDGIEGTYGKVRFGVDSKNGQKVAIKFLKEEEQYRDDAIAATKAGMFIMFIICSMHCNH